MPNRMVTTVMDGRMERLCEPAWLTWTLTFVKFRCGSEGHYEVVMATTLVSRISNVDLLLR
jgi:hypothetical protein